MSRKYSKNSFSFLDDVEETSEEEIVEEIKEEPKEIKEVVIPFGKKPDNPRIENVKKMIDRVKEADEIEKIIKDCSARHIRGRQEQIAEINRFYPEFDNRNNVMLHNPNIGIKKFRYFGIEKVIS